MLQLVKVVRKSGRGNAESVLDVACNHPLRVRRQEKLHDAEAGLCAHRGKHVRVATGPVGSELTPHTSIIVELQNDVKQKVPEDLC